MKTVSSLTQFGSAAHHVGDGAGFIRLVSSLRAAYFQRMLPFGTIDYEQLGLTELFIRIFARVIRQADARAPDLLFLLTGTSFLDFAWSNISGCFL